MKDLKCSRVRSSVIYWLMHIIVNEDDPCKKFLDDAIVSYMRRDVVRLVGVLIRDTPPNEADLRYAFERLRTDTKTCLDLWALYLAVPISSLSKRVGAA